MSGHVLWVEPSLRKDIELLFYLACAQGAWLDENVPSFSESLLDGAWTRVTIV